MPAMTPALAAGTSPGATAGGDPDTAPTTGAQAVGAQSATGGGEPAVSPAPVTRVSFGLDTLGRWCVEMHNAAGTCVQHLADGAAGGPLLDLDGYPTDDPAGAVALQQALRARFPGVDVAWRPGVMDTLDETTAAAHRALAAVGADRQAARAAADTAATSLRAAVLLARDAGLGPVEIADRTGYARSTITKILSTLTPGGEPPTPA